MSTTDTATASELAVDAELPDHVIRAVADAVTPAEAGPPGSVSSELIHRVMLETYRATNGCEHLDGPYRRLLAQVEAVRRWTRTTDQGTAAAQVQRLLDEHTL